MPNERPNMKKSRSGAKAIVSVEPIPQATVAGAGETRGLVESDLSPERMMEGVSTTTALLNEILAQQDGPHQLRDWGINE